MVDSSKNRCSSLSSSEYSQDVSSACASPTDSNNIPSYVNLYLNLFHRVASLVVNQLPLFLMLVIFMTAPSYFSGTPYFLTYLKRFLFYLLPQAILPALILCWLASLRRYIWWLIFVLATCVFMVELGCLFCQSWRFNSTFAALLMQTDSNEVWGFMQMYSVPIFKTVLCSVAIAAFSILLNRYWQRQLASLFVVKRFKKLPRISFIVVGFILVASVVYSPLQMNFALKKYEPRWSRIGNIMFVASTPIAYYYAFMDIFDNADMRDFETLAKVSQDLIVDTSAVQDSLNIVYVIGESFPRSKSNLYGYPLETNPFMLKEFNDGSLILFDNIISHSNHTWEVYPILLSTNEVHGSKPYVEYPLLPTIFKKGGFLVGYFDNQSALGTATHLDYSCTSFLSHKVVRESSLDLFNSKVMTLTVN